jgi:hypothetical protein
MAAANVGPGAGENEPRKTLSMRCAHKNEALHLARITWTDQLETKDPTFSTEHGYITFCVLSKVIQE